MGEYPFWGENALTCGKNKIVNNGFKLAMWKPDTKSEKIKVSVVVAGEVDSALAVDEVAMPAVLTQEDASVLPVLPELGERYEVIEFIGAGGMGAVWKVRDKTLDTIIAAKVLLPNLLTDPVSIKRFEKEAALATELHHPNIAAIYGPGKDVNGNTFITMAYVQGETLAQVLSRDGALHEKRVLDIAMQVIEALVYSHSKGIVHRDITPSNIVITKAESGADLVRLVDFGIARCIYDERTVTQALTRAISAFGSPMYMSPEQLLGEEATAKSDVYSLGCVIFEMATGKPPFDDESPVKGILQHLNSDPDLSKLSERLRPLVQMCLAKGPGERCSALSLHQSVEYLSRDEAQLLEQRRGFKLSYWQAFSIVLLCQASFAQLHHLGAVVFNALTYAVGFCFIANGSPYNRFQQSAGSFYSKEFWLASTFVVLVIGGIINLGGIPPVIPVGYAVSASLLFLWEPFRESLYVIFCKFHGPAYRAKEFANIQSQLKYMDSFALFARSVLAAILASFLAPLTLLLLCGIQYQEMPWSFSAKFQELIKYPLICAFGALVCLLPLVPGCRSKMQKWLSIIAMVASFVFVSVVMLNEPLLKCELKLWYAGFFPSWQSAVVQEAVEFPDDFIGRKAQTLALELPVADDAAQKAKLKIAEQILQSRHRAPESYALAAAVKLAYLTKDASHWGENSKLWDAAFEGFAMSEDYQYLHHMRFFEPTLINCGQFALFDSAVRAGDLDRASKVLLTIRPANSKYHTLKEEATRQLEELKRSLVQPGGQ